MTILCQHFKFQRYNNHFVRVMSLRKTRRMPNTGNVQFFFQLCILFIQYKKIKRSVEHRGSVCKILYQLTLISDSYGLFKKCKMAGNFLEYDFYFKFSVVFNATEREENIQHYFWCKVTRIYLLTICFGRL